MIDVFTMESEALPRGTRVVGFRGMEGISRLYAFEIHLTIGADESDDFDLSDPVGARATLKLDRQDGRPPFLFQGVFSEASLVHHEPDGRALVRAVLVPRLWRLTQTLHSRIFTAQSLPDILEAILKDNGLSSDDYVLKLSQQFKPEEHVCQYHESDFDFISRWMEREGLYYYFEHGDEREKLVITDNAAAHENLAPSPVRFFALAGGDATAKECLQTFVCRRRSLPASVQFKDHDYTKPTLDVSGAAPVSRTGLGEINLHGARFFTPEAGKRLAKLRAEEMQCREVVFTATGTAFHLRAGYTFALEDHPRAAFDAPYLVTEVEHHGNQGATTSELQQLTGLEAGDVYRVHVTAIPKVVQYRAELRTPWPRIYGTEQGEVDGEADSEYAQLDEHGRYSVRFAFDESGLEDGKASTRVRMMQPHGGGVEGWHFPLRKGTEVLFTFLGGDPDRPVIAGVVPNALTPSPVTRANQTRNVIQTGGRNRLEIEDKKGFERITMSTPNQSSYIRMGSANGAPEDDHNMIIRTHGDTLLHAGEDWDVDVGGALNEIVKGSVTETYKSNKNEHVDNGTVNETYLFHTTAVKDQRSGNYGSLRLYVGKTTNETYQGEHTTQSWSARTVEVGGAHTETSHAGRTTTVIGDWTQTITGVSKNFKYDAHAMLTVGATTDTFIGVKNSNSIAADIKLTLGADIKLMAGLSFSASYAADIKVIGGVKAEFGAAVDKRATGIKDTACVSWSVVAATSAKMYAGVVNIAGGVVNIV